MSFEFAANACNQRQMTTVNIWRSTAGPGHAGARYRASVVVTPSVHRRPAKDVAGRVITNPVATEVAGELSGGADVALSLLAACNAGAPFAVLAEMVC